MQPAYRDSFTWLHLQRCSSHNASLTERSVLQLVVGDFSRNILPTTPGIAHSISAPFLSQVTLFTRGKAPVTQQLPGESNLEYAEYSSRVRHLKGDRKDFDNLRSLLKGSGFQVVYDINGERFQDSPQLCIERQLVLVC